jgi:hypothetical protein
MRNHVQRSFDASLSELCEIYEKIDAIHESIGEQRRSIAARVSLLRTKNGVSMDVLAVKRVVLDLSEQILVRHEQFLLTFRDELLYILKYGRQLHSEFPEKEIIFEIPDLQVCLGSFLSESPDILSLKKQREALKKAIKNRPPTLGCRDRLESLFLSLEAIFDANFCYFPDFGTHQAEFESALDLVQVEFHTRMRERIFEVTANPENIGWILLAQCDDLSRSKKFDKDKANKFTFLLFARHFFGRIYVDRWLRKPMKLAVLDFQSRIYELRKLTSIGLGFGQKYLGDRFSGLRLVDFPSDHPYGAAVAEFSSMNFVVCPIDFCWKAHRALRLVQDAARDVLYEIVSNETGRVLGKSELSLSLDDLFDISLIVFLISDPLDTVTLLEEFDSYMSGLHIPSAFLFGFTHMKALCSQIMGLDMKGLLAEANQRVEKDEEIDPLNILKGKG